MPIEPDALTETSDPVHVHIAAARATLGLPSHQPRALFVARGAAGSKWFYNNQLGEWRLVDPYCENVPDALARWCADNGWTLTVLYERPTPAFAPPERLPYADRYPGVVEEFFLDDIAPLMKNDRTVAPAFAEHYRASVFDDDGFREAFSYRGIVLFDTMIDQMTAIPLSATRYIQQKQRWTRILSGLAPKVVFAGRLDIRSDLNAAAHALGMKTVTIKLGISEEMLIPFAVADTDGRFDTVTSPDVIAVWGERQKALVERRFPKVSSHIVVSGRTRNDSFAAPPKPAERRALRDFLTLAPGTRVIVYGANYMTKYGQVKDAGFGTCCMSAESFRRGLEELVKLTERRGDCVVVVKPHPSDDLPFIKSLVDSMDSPFLRYLTDADGFHNAVLLHEAEVFVSSVSSMFAEAALAGCVAVNLWTSDINYLYESERKRIYGTISNTVESWSALVDECDRLLAEDAYHAESLERARAGIPPIFGGFDGKNADRLVALSLTALGETGGPRLDVARSSPNNTLTGMGGSL